VPLLVQEFGEFQQATISGPVVEPQDRIDVILPAVFTPIPEWPARQFAQLIREILPHDGYYARIATDLLVLSKDLEHDHARPPIVVSQRSNLTVRALVG